jgi:hypothetical protein
VLAEPGVRYVQLHDGWHTAGTLMAEQGVHVRTIQQILGHTDVRTTQGYVTWLRPWSGTPPSGWAARCGATGNCYPNCSLNRPGPFRNLGKGLIRC